MNVSVNLKFALTVAAVLVVICMAMAMGHAQDEPKQVTKPSGVPTLPTDPNAAVTVPAQHLSAYTPTTDEDKDLKISQLAAQLAQSQLAAKEQTLPEFTQFQAQMQTLRQQCVKVISAHKWPAAVQCDIQSVPVRFCEGTLPCPMAASAMAPSATPSPAPATKK